MTFSRELARHLAARLGESESAVSRALLGMAPVLLCQIIVKTGEGRGSALYALTGAVPVASYQNQPSITEMLGLLGSRENETGTWAIGQGLLTEAFGGQLPALTVFMSTYARVRLQSAHELLQLVAAVLVTGLARHVAQEGFNAGQLITELASAKNLAYGWLPENLSQWPGYRRRDAVPAPHALWAAELARPYWVLVLAAGVVMLLVMTVMGAGQEIAAAQNASRAKTKSAAGMSTQVPVWAKQLPRVAQP